MDGALDSLHQQAWGTFLLALTDTGLIAYGMFGFVQIRYRRVDAPRVQTAGQLDVTRTAQIRFTRCTAFARNIELVSLVCCSVLQVGVARQNFGTKWPRGL